MLKKVFAVSLLFVNLFTVSALANTMNNSQLVDETNYSEISDKEIPMTTNDNAPLIESKERKSVYGLPYSFSYDFDTSIESRYSFRGYTSVKITTNSDVYKGTSRYDRITVYLEEDTWYGAKAFKDSWNSIKGVDTCHFSGLDKDTKYQFRLRKATDGAWVRGEGVVEVW